MELHYIKNEFFMPDNYILNNAKVLENIPGYIVQGRYDLICLPINAYNLSEKWKMSELILVNTAGHSSSDQGIIENLQNCLINLSNKFNSNKTYLFFSFCLILFKISFFSIF